MAVKYFKDWNEVPLYLSVKDCAILIDKSQESVRRMIRKGKLKAQKFDGTLRIPKEVVRNYDEGVETKS